MISFSVLSGGGSLAGASAVTDAQGVATMVAQLGSPGVNSYSASIPPASEVRTRNFIVDAGENHSASAAASFTSPPPIIPA